MQFHVVHLNKKTPTLQKFSLWFYLHPLDWHLVVQNGHWDNKSPLQGQAAPACPHRHPFSMLGLSTACLSTTSLCADLKDPPCLRDAISLIEH